MIRVVKMQFKTEHVETFKKLFNERKESISAQEGCTHLELWQDITNPEIFFTYSHWQHPDNLEQYRKSDFFSDTWSKTKILFAAKAEAWSVAQLAKVI
ncbi:MAG TPA: antibiotic biosynthesis monooxygenase family protein [Edaphocola sp.]|nr:antibiotic biosynthesis monooxygenase family protein [Edaphocola sp.]